jgi:hypothetical protein
LGFLDVGYQVRWRGDRLLIFNPSNVNLFGGMFYTTPWYLGGKNS